MKDYGDIDSKFRYVILAAMRAKQLLSGAKPRIKSRSKNLIRIAQEEVKKGLVDYELVKAVKEEMEDVSSSDKEMFIGEEIVPDFKEEPVEKSLEDEEPELEDEEPELEDEETELEDEEPELEDEEPEEEKED